MLREKLNTQLREAQYEGDDCAVATLRLIAAALKERDITAREAGRADGIGDDEIVAMLNDMITQRRTEIQRCESCAQLDLAEREAREIEVIRSLLPRPLDSNETERAVDDAIGETAAHEMRDAGRVVSALKARYAGRLDLSRAKRLIRERLH